MLTNAISTGGQSILNILHGGNGQACAEDERPRLTAVTSSTSAVASFEIEKGGHGGAPERICYHCEDVSTGVGTPLAANLGSSTPQSVWDALEEIDVVQQELTKIILRE